MEGLQSGVKKSRNRNKCSFAGCSTTKAKFPKLQFFYSPTNRRAICKQWVHNCENEALNSMEKNSLKWKVVCDRHFKQDCSTSLMRSKLTKEAVPTIAYLDGVEVGDVERCASPIPGPSSMPNNSSLQCTRTSSTNIHFLKQVTLDSKTDDYQLTTNRIQLNCSLCSVVGCKRRANDDQHSFAFPVHNKDLCQKWISFCRNESLQSLSESELVLRKICELHFTQASFASRKVLKKDAVPIRTKISSRAEGNIGQTTDVATTKTCSSFAEGNACNQTTSSEFNLKPEASRKILVLRLNLNTTEENLKIYFEHWGDIIDLKIKRDPRTKRSLGFGYVTFTHSEMVDKVISDCPHTIDDCAVKIERELNLESEQSRKIKILRLHPDTTEETLMNYFEHWGDVVGVVQRRDLLSKKSLGFGLVTFTHSAMVDQVISDGPHTIDRRQVKIERVRPEVKISNVCAYIGCQSRYDDPSLQFFWFPDHCKELLKQWTFNCGYDDDYKSSRFCINSGKVCEKHFTEDSFEIIIERNALKEDAVPSKLQCNIKPPNQYQTNDHYTLSEEEKNNFSSNQQTESQLSAHTLFDETWDSWSLPEDSRESSTQNQGEHAYARQTCDGEKAEVSCSPALKVKPPARTYIRTAPKRQVPASCGEAEKIEGKKIKATKSVTVLKSGEGKETNLDLSHENKSETMYVEINALTGCSDPATLLTTNENQDSDKSSTNEFSIHSNILHSCYFCGWKNAEIGKHLVREHINKEELKIIHNLNDKAREKYLLFLTRVGDFKHNSQVLGKGEGMLISLGGRCHDVGTSNLPLLPTVDKDEFMPCPNCTAFVYESSLKYHHNSCLFKDISVPLSLERNVICESMAMLAYVKKQKLQNLKLYFSKRLKSIFGSIAKEDELIMLLIPYLFSSKKSQDTSSILLLLQRFGFILQLYRRISGKQNTTFHDILKPECVELLLKALQSFFKEITETDRAGLYKSIYLHISMSAFIWRGKCLIVGDLKSAMEALQFFYQFTNMYKEKFNSELNVKKLEVTSDIDHSESIAYSPDGIIAFNNLLNERIEQLMNSLCDKSVSKETLKSVWHELAETTLCLMCLTNPVDFEAIEGIKLIEYAVRPDSATDNLTKFESMIPPYHKISKKYVYFCTAYLDSEFVITLSSKLKKAIDTLIMRRKEGGVPVMHSKIFSGCHESSLSAVNIFYNRCVKGNRTFTVDVIRDVKKRRQVSHIIHISDMSPDELGLMKDYLESSGDLESSQQFSPEDCYRFDIEKEVKEALHTFETSKKDNPTNGNYTVSLLSKVKHNERNEVPQDMSNNAETQSTQNDCEEVDLLPLSGTKGKKEACTQVQQKKRKKTFQDYKSATVMGEKSSGEPLMDLKSTKE